MINDGKKKYKQWQQEVRSDLLTYHKQTHLALLNAEKPQHEKGRLVPKLTNYNIIQNEQLHWEIKEQYLELFENYMKKKISTNTFVHEFLRRHKPVYELSNLLLSNRIFLSPAKECLDFGDLIEQTENLCDAYSPDPDPDCYEIDAAHFQTVIEKVYLKIRNF